MAVIHVNFVLKKIMKKDISIEAKWEECQPYYERAYQRRFKVRPSDKDVNDLYEKMYLLADESVQVKKPTCAHGCEVATLSTNVRK